MIDLNRTRAGMFAEIHASAHILDSPLRWSGVPGGPPVVEAFASKSEVCLLVQGTTPAAVLPVLNDAFTARFGDIRPQQLVRDLLDPIRKGVGNAYKWGNLRDPSRQISVEAVATRSGAVVSISDEGAGFDVQSVIQKYREHQKYFTHGGSGIKHFEKARSSISYSNGGRTLLIRFACLWDQGGRAASENIAEVDRLSDEIRLKHLLATGLPYFRSGRATLEGCCAYRSDGGGAHGNEARWALQYRIGKSTDARHTVLTARVLPASLAAADFAVATELYKRGFRRRAGIAIPKPLAMLDLDHLRVVLFKFSPLYDLRAHLKSIEDEAKLTAVIQAIGRGLRTLHESRIAAPNEELAESITRGLDAGNAAVARLADDRPERAGRVEKFLDRLRERAATIRSERPVPVHGAFEWKSIVHDGTRLHFYRFETCRRSHPGFDAGSFLADLRRFSLVRRKPERNRYELARGAFLDAYFSDDSASWREDLPFFTAYALLQRIEALLRRPREKWESKVDTLLDQCEDALETKELLT
jgi:hypothetical protein